MAAHEKVFGKRVDRLGADAVQADAELKNVVVVFRAGVDFGNAVHDFAERNAAPEIAHADAVVRDLNLHFLAVAHDVFVNRVVHDLLEQNVAAVVGVVAVADAPDIHARAQPDVLQRRQRLDLALVVIVLCVFSHRNFVAGKMRQTGKEFNAKPRNRPPRYILRRAGSARGKARTNRPGRADGILSLLLPASRQHFDHPFVCFFVGFETKDTARRAQPAKRLLPANGGRLIAGRRGKRIGRFRAAADETVNFFLDVDERWLHGAVSLIVCLPQSKLAAVKMRQMRKEFKAKPQRCLTAASANFFDADS